MAIDPIASEAALSSNGFQLMPPLRGRNTPPSAAPTNAMLGLVGSTAIAVTLPETLAMPPSTNALGMGAGPMGFHVGTIAGADALAICASASALDCTAAS